MARMLGEAFRIWVAWADGQPAAVIVVVQGANADFRGMMDKDLAGPTKANNLLLRLAIQEACEAGCRHYHMGESGYSTSLARFKTGFGARPTPYFEYHLERLPLERSARGVVKRAIGFRE